MYSLLNIILWFYYGDQAVRRPLKLCGWGSLIELFLAPGDRSPRKLSTESFLLTESSRLIAHPWLLLATRSFITVSLASKCFCPEFQLSSRDQIGCQYYSINYYFVKRQKQRLKKSLCCKVLIQTKPNTDHFFDGELRPNSEHLAIASDRSATIEIKSLAIAADLI